MRSPDPALLSALSAELERHVGRANAATWGDLVFRMNGYPYYLDVRAPRRLQEAALVLRSRGVPVVGLSGSGVFLAQTVDEVDDAIREKRGRALAALADLRVAKRIKATMLGQLACGGTR
jgi:hypothetical protein